MSLLQATSLITSATKAIKTGKLPDLKSTVGALTAAGVLTSSEAKLVNQGLSLGSTIASGTSPSLYSTTDSMASVGILTKTSANSLNKSINVASSSLPTSVTSSANKLLATLTKTGVIDASTSKLISNSLSILNAASNGNTGGVIAGALKLAGVSSSNAKAASTIMNAVPMLVDEAKAGAGYKTTDNILPNIGSPGILTKADCVKLLIACQNAIAKKYVVNGKRNVWRKVHNRGEYGAYRMSISQLIDIKFFSHEIQAWAEDSIQSHPHGPGAAERIKSYAEAVQETPGDYDFAPYKRESANNLQYFFLYNPIPINYEAASRSMISFITSEEMQDKAAYYYLKKAYVDLSSAKIINENTSKATIAGLLSIALCSKLDDAIKFSQGIIKTNADGINSKYWYDIGWNALADKPKNINSDELLIRQGVRPPTTEISTKALIETSKDLADIMAGKNINGVVSGLVKSGIIPKDVGAIINAGLGIATSVINDKLSEINKVQSQLQSASSLLPAGASSALKSISSISSAVGGVSSKVPSISSVSSIAGISKSLPSATSVASLSKQVSSLANQVQSIATEAVGAAVGAVGASGSVDPAALSFVGESLKSGFGLANDSQTAVINELNRRGLCPPGSTALLRASIDGVTDPSKISDLISAEVDKMGNVGSAIPALNMKLIEDTGAKPGLLDKFEKAKAASITAIGVSAPELTALISAAGTSSLATLQNKASSTANSLLTTATTSVSGLDLAHNLTSVAAGAKDPLAAASALGAAAVSKVSGAASSAAGAVTGIAGNAKGALENAAGGVTNALTSAAGNVSGLLGGSVPSVSEKPAEGQIVSSYLPVTPATVPETPKTGTASADAVPTLPSTQVSAAVGGPTQASTPPVDPNPMKSPYGTVEVSYQWTASNGVVTVSANGTPVASVNLIDKTDTKTSQYQTLIAAIDGAIKQERINNYKPPVPKTFSYKMGTYQFPQQNGNLPYNATDLSATVLENFAGGGHAIEVKGLKLINYRSYESQYIITVERPQGMETISEQLQREIKDVTSDIQDFNKAINADPANSDSIKKWDLPSAEAYRQLLEDLLSKHGDILFQYNAWVRNFNDPPLGPDTTVSTDLAKAKAGIAGEYTTNLEKVKKTFSNNTPVASQSPSKSSDDGKTTTVITEKYGDGSVVTTTIVEDQKGFASKEKTVNKVAPPIASPAPNTNPQKTDTVSHPATDDPQQSVSQFPAAADSIPVTNDGSKGYTDPKGQYPKKSLGGKPDTNPLAVGINSPHIQNDPKSIGAKQESLSAGASPVAKNALRKRDVPKAGRHGGSWSQPETPYAAQYPYNKVNASESGHVTEVDDTPGAERLHTAHKSGTFEEIGPNGTKVTRIVGDNYTIVDSNGYILIEGRANVHVAGECNVMIMGDANLTMNGKVNMDVHNDFNLNVAGHFGLSVGGGIFIRNDGVFSHENKGDIQIHGAADFKSTIDGTQNFTASGYKMTSKGDYHVKVAGISYHTSVGNINHDTDGSIMSKAAETIDSKSGTHTNIESLGNTNIKSAGSVNTESIASTNVKSANVVNVEGTDSINVKSGNAVNVKSAAATNVKAGAAVNVQSADATNVKSGAAVNVEGAGNINLKAPEVASSKFSAPTIDVSTLNAATTNLKGTHNSPDDTTNIKGSASPVSAGSAGAAVDAGSANSADPASEATGAKIAILANTVPVEKPVSISVTPIVAGVDGNQTTAHGGSSSPINSAGGAQHDFRDFAREAHD